MWNDREICIGMNRSSKGNGKNIEIHWRRGEKIKNILEKNDMMEVEAGHKLVEFWKDKQ